MLVEEVADELADPAMADDNHPLGLIGRRQLCRRPVAGHLLGHALGRAACEQRHEGQGAHGQGHDRENARGHAGFDKANLHGKPDADEGELAARRQQQAGLDAGGPRHAEQAAERHQKDRLGDHHGDETADHEHRFPPNEAQVDMHAD